MKVKLLKKLRQRFQILKEGDMYFLTDWKSLNEYHNYPYRYMASNDLSKVRQQRRDEILNTFKRKSRVIN